MPYLPTEYFRKIYIYFRNGCILNISLYTIDVYDYTRFINHILLFLFYIQAFLSIEVKFIHLLVSFFHSMPIIIIQLFPISRQTPWFFFLSLYTVFPQMSSDLADTHTYMHVLTHSGKWLDQSDMHHFEQL